MGWHFIHSSDMSTPCPLCSISYDFSSCSIQALAKAVVLARQFGAAITLIYVMDLNLHTPPMGPANPEKIQKLLFKEGREQLDNMAMKLMDERVELRTVIQEGLPCESICEAARQSDLIVIGNALRLLRGGRRW